ncbi:hypothetical protein GALMADRAFT_65679, partial [Galerina marginata CBS 339.88]
IVKVLLENGAEVNAQGGFYGNALQVASYGGHKGIVKMLLENGAEVNPLAIQSVSDPVIRKLLQDANL